MTIESTATTDLERTALRLTLSKLFDDETIQQVFSFFESNYVLSMDNGYPLTRSQIESALEKFFKSGAAVIMPEYDKTFYELTSKKQAVA